MVNFCIAPTSRAIRGNYSGRRHIIEVVEDSTVDFQKKVTDWLGETVQEWEFIVNLTGGPKLMSISAYDLFTDFGSEMVYVPLNREEVLDNNCDLKPHLVERDRRFSTKMLRLLKDKDVNACFKKEIFDRS
jgi:hypothetical protein